jgi:hypothetical protein
MEPSDETLRSRNYYKRLLHELLEVAEETLDEDGLAEISAYLRATEVAQTEMGLVMIGLRMDEMLRRLTTVYLARREPEAATILAGIHGR